MFKKSQLHKQSLLESQLWLSLLKLGIITNYSANPQIIKDDGYIVQFVFEYNGQFWSGSACYHEWNDYPLPLPRYMADIISIDYPIQSVWDSTLCDYVWIQYAPSKGDVR